VSAARSEFLTLVHSVKPTCLSLLAAPESSALTRANPPKGGDAKPPVYGHTVYDSGVAGDTEQAYSRAGAGVLGGDRTRAPRICGVPTPHTPFPASCNQICVRPLSFHRSEHLRVHAECTSLFQPTASR
jgi:hypothetical protein